MSETPQLTEYERAKLRKDLANLRRVIAEHVDWNRAHDAGLDSISHPLDPIITERADPERNLALVAIAMNEQEDTSYLGLVSAGLLEDIFFMENDVPIPLLKRIEAEARRNPRFCWMLSGMYTTSFKPEFRAMVESFTRGISLDDPLPPLITQ